MNKIKTYTVSKTKEQNSTDNEQYITDIYWPSAD